VDNSAVYMLLGDDSFAPVGIAPGSTKASCTWAGYHSEAQLNGTSVLYAVVPELPPGTAAVYKKKKEKGGGQVGPWPCGMTCSRRRMAGWCTVQYSLPLLPYCTIATTSLYTCVLCCSAPPRVRPAALGGVHPGVPNGDWFIERQISSMAKALAETATDPFLLSQRAWYMPALGYGIGEDCKTSVSGPNIPFPALSSRSQSMRVNSWVATCPFV